MKKHLKKYRSLFAYGMAFALIIGTIAAIPTQTTDAAKRSQAQTGNSGLRFSRRPAPDVDTTLTATPTRGASAVQQQAITSFKSQYGRRTTIRWNDFTGSPDVIMGFHTAPSSDTPENAARAFINTNSALLAVDSSSLVLDDQKEGMGGYMLHFKQTTNGLDIAGGGIGILMNRDKQIRMVMGSPFRDVAVTAGLAKGEGESLTTPITAAVAAAKVETDLARYSSGTLLASQSSIINAGLDAIQNEISPVLRSPRLNVFPTANGYRVAWDVVTYSRNPFGVFYSQVDANTGEILKRQDQVKYQDPSPYTADIYPSTPGIANYDTGELQLDGNGEPAGLTRIQLRGYNPGMAQTAVNGVLTGPHALVKNVLPGQQPFAQASQGTFHFRTNNAPVESQPNEADDRAEPAEHFDGVNMFFFINYLLEYVDDIHKRDDLVNNPIGTGSFPDNYTNYDRPLVGLVHIPNIGATGDIYGPEIDNGYAVEVATGYDNAGSFPLTQTVDTPAGPQKVVVNPTIYGHGYFLNDPAKDGPVAYHEGMHSISTPIAGLEGAPEGAAMNEGQADLWAYAISGNDSIGQHTIQGSRYRRLYRDNNRDPNSLAWIRSAHSTLKYSQLGTLGNPPSFEEHKDGEIYAATMFELLTLMKAQEPQMQFKRPAFVDGAITRDISRGQESWERIFLGSLYLLGLTSPDTFVKARDAMIQSDRILYPTDPSDMDAPGQHENLIWNVFAAREMGVNAMSPQGGVVTISTGVPSSKARALDAPQGVSISPASATSVKVSWQPVAGAYAYQIFKRKRGTAGHRQYQGVPGRPYFDGDQAISGWTHVGYATGGSTTEFTDEGVIREYYKAAGISSTDNAAGFNEMFDTEYSVRSIYAAKNHVAGFSDLSGSAGFTSSNQDISSSIETALSNISFANGVFQFDQTLKNKGLQNAADKTFYGPLNFRVMRISNPTVTVANADSGGNGQNGPASFAYKQTLAANQVSTPKTLKFNDPGSQLFTFDALINARVRGDSPLAFGSQPYDGDGGGTQVHTITTQEDTYTGTILVGSIEVRGAIEGVDYVDVPFTALPGSFGVTGVMNSTLTPSDLDFELLDSEGHVLSSSGNTLTDETCSAVIVPGRTYIYRVIGYLTGPNQFAIHSTQYFSDTITGGGSQFAGTQTPGRTTGLHSVRFTVNPLLRTVTARLL